MGGGGSALVGSPAPAGEHVEALGGITEGDGAAAAAAGPETNSVTYCSRAACLSTTPVARCPAITEVT